MSAETITDLLQRNHFLRTLFEAVPCGVVIVDEQAQVHAVNDLMRQTFGRRPPTGLEKGFGDVLGCRNAAESPDGCGTSGECGNCLVRRTALEAVNGRRIHRARTTLNVGEGPDARRVSLQVSAAPVTHEGRRMAVVLLEDVTELARLRRRLKAEESFAGIVGRDPRMQELYETIRELAGVDAPVLIEGESGTGKELVAAALHNEGPRAGREFVAVNCSALPEGLIESELFGHVRGAFTGALRDKRGRFELADGGTIFLDEVADISPVIQSKLLRVLQEGVIEPVGSEKSIRVDVRVISATNRNLRARVAEGRFREDLFYRLCVVPISLPSLRERRTDIPLLAEHLLARTMDQWGIQSEVTISDEAMARLVDCDWPGNVRELENAIQHALVKCRKGEIGPEHLPPDIRGAGPGARRRGARRRKLDAASVRQALSETAGNRAAAARKLGIARATLYRFLADSGIEADAG